MRYHSITSSYAAHVARLLRAAAATLAALVGASCGFDSDWGGSDAHRCTVTLSRDWEAETRSMRVQHEDPKRCPVPVAFGEIGTSVYLSGSVVDDNADDVVEGEILNVFVRNGCGTPKKLVEYAFRPSRGNHVADYETYYPVATGLNDYCGYASDEGDVSTTLADVPETVHAYINLTVLYGDRATQMLSPDPYSATPFVIPAESHCSYSAQSTLGGVVRTGMSHRWYVDGEERGGGANPSIYMLLAEGWHTLRVDGIDEHGYRTTSGEMWFEVGSVNDCP